VVFESDLDQYGSLSWNAVEGEIRKYTTSCSYDRTGIICSEQGPRPRYGETIAAELNTRSKNCSPDDVVPVLLHRDNTMASGLRDGKSPLNGGIQLLRKVRFMFITHSRMEMNPIQDFPKQYLPYQQGAKMMDGQRLPGAALLMHLSS